MSEITNSNLINTGRKQWLFENCISKLVQSLKERENIIVDKQQAFETVIQADPSQNKSAAQWIVECYLRQGFLWEDIQGKNTSKVSETLRLFSKYKRNLTVEKRNIYQYQNLSDLYSNVQNYHLNELEQNELFKGRELKRWEKQQALENTCILLDEPALKIIIPLTEQASRWWGKGTRWCTAADKNNMFEKYNARAPLFIIMFKDTDDKYRKLQLWHWKNDWSDNSLQFMDENDANITDKFVENNWDNLKDILTYYTNIDGNCLFNVPRTCQSLSLCTQAVLKTGTALNYVADEYQTLELCVLACEQNLVAFNFVPSALKNKDFFKALVSKNGLTLKLVPYYLIDSELCLAAVLQNGDALKYISEELKTKELCEQAVQQTGKSIWYVPPQLIDEKLCLLAVQQTSDALEFIPTKMINLNLCMVACKQSGTTLFYVPKQLKNEDLCLLAVKNDGLALQYVPKELRTEQLCSIACQQDGLAMNHVPQDLRTPELYTIACESNGSALQFVPVNLRTQLLCKTAVEQDGLAIFYVPKEFKDYSLYLSACKQNSSSLTYVPDEFRTKELMNSCNQTDYAIQDKSWDLQTVKNNFYKFKDNLTSKSNDLKEKGYDR